MPEGWFPPPDICLWHDLFACADTFNCRQFHRGCAENRTEIRGASGTPRGGQWGLGRQNREPSACRRPSTNAACRWCSFHFDLSASFGSGRRKIMEGNHGDGACLGGFGAMGGSVHRGGWLVGWETGFQLVGPEFGRHRGGEIRAPSGFAPTIGGCGRGNDRNDALCIRRHVISGTARV
jgi:hypothetical protein